MEKRDSKFEIIRILSMIFIIAYHYTMYGGWTVYNSVKIQFFRPWGQVGVALFVLITGYFLGVKETDFNQAWHQINKLWIKTLVYSWIILICAVFFHFSIVNKDDLLYAIFPIIFDEYWFITSYIVLILLIPILNTAIHNFDKKNLLMLLVSIIIFADIVPFIKNNGTPNTPLGGALSVGSMFAPYLIGALIHQYKIKLKMYQAWLIAVLGVVLEYVSLLVLKRGVMKLDIANFTLGLLPLITAVGIFLIIINSPTFHSKIINWIASGVLAAYLITEHPLFRIYFWQKILHVSQYQVPFWKFVIMGIVIAVTTVVICSLIDKIYERVRVFVKKKNEI